MIAEKIIAVEVVCVVVGLLVLVAVFVAAYWHGLGGGTR